MQDLLTIIIDGGSGMFKAGFAGDGAPRCVFSSIVGRPKPGCWFRYKQDVYLGDDACAKAGVLHLASPIERGIVTHWDDMEKIYHDMFYHQLYVDPAEHPILLAEPPMNPKNNREKMLQLQFETFNVPCLYVALQGVLSLYSSGRTTGVALDIGDGVTQVIPIHEGYSVPHAVIRQNFGGSDLTYWLEHLYDHVHDFKTFWRSPARLLFNHMKERTTYVALDFDSEMRKAANTIECNLSYTLPDGNGIGLASARFRCPELLFQPLLNRFEFDGIHKILFDSIMKCRTDMHKDLYANIVLSGGSTMFRGLAERMEKEIVKVAPWTMKVKVVAPPDRKYAVWIGGSILASVATFPQMVITQEEYNENGPTIGHRKCF